MSPGHALRFAVGTKSGAHRLGVTGPPGAGKSTLIGALTEHWIAAGSTVGILAIDPTSPFSGGSLLGDRVRMDGMSGAENAFIRSVPSRSAVDGLCPNVAPMLDAFDDAGLQRVILETVGIGQVNYEARDLVDTFVLVLVPESGDTIQAMKAGIVETADICVVNKADRPGANKLVAELLSIAKWRSKTTGRRPAVLPVAANAKSGISELVGAIDEHRAALTADRRRDLTIRRQNFHLKTCIQRRLDEILGEIPAEVRANNAQRWQHALSSLKAI